MNILMTGGTGMIGEAFIRRFPQYQFTVVSRSPERAQKLLPAPVKVIASLNSLEHLDGFDAVINLAGEPIIAKRWSDRQKRIISDSRWQTTQRLVELISLSQQPPKVFLSGSAIGIYGDRGEEQLPETAPLAESDFPSALCLRWESIARQAEPYTRVVLLRTGIVLAAHQGALAKMLLPFKLCLGGRIGHGRQFMAWIHLDDHLRAMAHLLTEEGLSGPVNLVAPEAQSNRAFTQALALALGRFAVLPLPAKMLQLAMGESACLLLGSQRVIPETLSASGFRFDFPQLQPALRNLLEKE